MNENKLKKMLQRRELVKSFLVGGGYLGLRSLALGLPPQFLLNRKVLAQTATPTFLVFAENIAGCPINANVPGTYIPNVRHPDVDGFRTPITARFGNQDLQAAIPWTRLPADLRARLHFFHHQTGSSAHPESNLVQTVFGSIRAQTANTPEMLASAIAQETASGLGSLRTTPMCLSGSLTFKGMNQPQIGPTNLKSLFGTQLSDLDRSIAQVRAVALDKIYADLKQTGTRAERKFLDDHALSAKQSRDLGEQLATYMSNISTNNQTDQLRTAAALFAMNIAPVVRLQMNFGGDNHEDTTLANEVSRHNEASQALSVFWEELQRYNLTEKVTFANLNVFGRTLDFRAGRGRDHNRLHSTMVAFGPNVMGGMSGSVQSNFGASGINSETGTANSADIKPEETHASAAKSLMKAVGIDDAIIQKRVQGGKIVKTFLRG